MEWMKYENRCYLCSIWYGICVSFGCFWVWVPYSCFKIVAGIAIFTGLSVSLVNNIISIVHIKSIGQIIKIIICEIAIFFVTFVVAMAFWPAIFELIGLIIDFVKPAAAK